MREFVTGALDNAGLPVSTASAAISVSAGQARLRDIVIGADGADLQATVNVDLADAMLDALLTLNAPAAGAGRGASGRADRAQGRAAVAPAHGRYQSLDQLADLAGAGAAGPADRCDGAGGARGGSRRGRGAADAGRTRGEARAGCAQRAGRAVAAMRPMEMPEALRPRRCRRRSRYRQRRGRVPRRAPTTRRRLARLRSPDLFGAQN